MKLRKINDEVYYTDPGLILLDKNTLFEQEKLAQQTPRKRSRICTHKDEHDILQEMFIIHYRDTYVRAHSHKTKTESFHVISGTADVCIYDEKGNVIERISLGDYQSGKSFYYRIGPQIIHSLVITSDVFIFHETTLGPFNREDTFFPEWAPEKSNK